MKTAMAPLSGSEKAAVVAFFASRRGSRVLYPDVQTALCDYFVARGLTIAELPTARPPEGTRLARWLEECNDCEVRCKK